MTGESHVEALVAGGGGGGFQNPATEDLLMAGYNISGVQNIYSPNASADGIDADDFTIRAGSAVGSSSADGGELHLYGGDAQDIGQAGDVIIRGGTADRVPGGAVIIEGGPNLFGTGNTGAIIRLTTGAGGSSGASGSMNLTTPNGNGAADSGKISLRPGAGGTSGGDGGVIELLGGIAAGTGGTGSALYFKSGNSFAGGASYSGDIDIKIGTMGGLGNAGTLNITGADGGTGGIGTTINLAAGGSNVSAGGAINIDTGSGLAGNTPGGDLNVTTGNAYGTTQHGGDMLFTCGTGVGSGEGGDFRAYAGTGGATADGGVAEIRAGDGGATSGDGGDVILRPGGETNGKRGLVRLFRGSFGEGVVNNGTIPSGFTIEPHITGWTRFTWGAAATGTVDIGTLRSSSPAFSVGVEHTVVVTNGGQGTLTWGTMVEWAGGSAPTLTAAGEDWLRFYTLDDGATWIGHVIALNPS